MNVRVDKRALLKVEQDHEEEFLLRANQSRAETIKLSLVQLQRRDNRLMLGDLIIMAADLEKAIEEKRKELG